MAVYLKDRKHYEDLYDKVTVEIGRRESNALLESYEMFYKKASGLVCGLGRPGLRFEGIAIFYFGFAPLT